MRDGSPKTIYRKEYTAPKFTITDADLTFAIYDGYTLVSSKLRLQRQAKDEAPWILDGEDLEIECIEIDGAPLQPHEYNYDGSQLTLPAIGDSCQLFTRVRIFPETNTALEGLYRSRTIYCTQCEAEGFRKITFFLDRPDVLAIFTVTVEADKLACPILLSNGNSVSQEDLPEGRHRSRWHDPWPKPCYLFALVAGELECVSDAFTTASGREVALNIFVEAKDVHYCDHAMDSLKRSMQWDEEIYGLEYDLDLFNIVAVDDFNMGAMENKGLNIFNTSCVLASPDITTDAGYLRIESIVAHEYFHNFSGNRVTCRDWFQLSLKEGFTVFRDSQFSADMNSPGVKRVEDVSFLRTHQFAEDAGPMAHPVRPDSFIEISNFYTLTVYEKGAEVVRMLYTLLGHELFTAGSKLYFEQHDGQAVTCDDFVSAMEQVSSKDLTQFRRWYEQSGTPELVIDDQYDPMTKRVTLTVTQNNGSGPDGSKKPPLHLPLAIGLVVNGQSHTFEEGNSTRLLEVREASQTFQIENVQEKPAASLLRGFSAPVRLRSADDDDTLAALISSDSDEFVKWDAMQRYSSRVIEAQMRGDPLSDAFISAYRKAMSSDTDDAMKALLLLLPSEESLADRQAQQGSVDVFQIREAREYVKKMLAIEFQEQWTDWFNSYSISEPYQPNGWQIGRRALRHLSLSYLSYALSSDALAWAETMLHNADNLSDRLAALRVLVNADNESVRSSALEDFYQQWQHEALIVNQWFTLQATRPSPDTVDAVLQLQNHGAFDWRNPNKVRALVGGFASANPTAFHRQDGGGYALLGDVIARVQSANPQIAARLCTPLTRYRRYAHGVDAMQQQLERIAGLENLSRDVYEVVGKALEE
jgi:aminopeptidase N